MEAEQKKSCIPQAPLPPKKAGDADYPKLARTWCGRLAACGWTIASCNQVYEPYFRRFFDPGHLAEAAKKLVGTRPVAPTTTADPHPAGITDLTNVAGWKRTRKVRRKDGTTYEIGPQCRDGWTRIDKDLNKGAKGKFIYFCHKSQPKRAPLTAIKFTVHKRDGDWCGEGWEQVGSDLNAGIKSTYIYTCVQREAGQRPVIDLEVTIGWNRENRCKSGWTRIGTDLNKGAKGRYIYLCVKYGKTPQPPLWSAPNAPVHRPASVLGAPISVSSKSYIPPTAVTSDYLKLMLMLRAMQKLAPNPVRHRILRRVQTEYVRLRSTVATQPVLRRARQWIYLMGRAIEAHGTGARAEYKRLVAQAEALHRRLVLRGSVFARQRLRIAITTARARVRQVRGFLVPDDFIELPVVLGRYPGQAAMARTPQGRVFLYAQGVEHAYRTALARIGVALTLNPSSRRLVQERRQVMSSYRYLRPFLRQAGSASTQHLSLLRKELARFHAAQLRRERIWEALSRRAWQQFKRKVHPDVIRLAYQADKNSQTYKQAGINHMKLIWEVALDNLRYRYRSIVFIGSLLSIDEIRLTEKWLSSNGHLVDAKRSVAEESASSARAKALIARLVPKRQEIDELDVFWNALWWSSWKEFAIDVALVAATAGLSRLARTTQRVRATKEIIQAANRAGHLQRGFRRKLTRLERAEKSLARARRLRRGDIRRVLITRRPRFAIENRWYSFPRRSTAVSSQKTLHPAMPVWAGISRSDPRTYYTYKELRELIKKAGLSGRGKGLEAHHLLEKQFARIVGVKRDDIISVALTPRWHRGVQAGTRGVAGANIDKKITDELRRITGGATPTPRQIWQAHRRVYERMKQRNWADAIYELYFKPKGIKYY